MNLFFQNQKNKEHLVVLIDIGSASVGGALILINKKSNPKIVYSVRRDMAFQKKLDFDRFHSSMLESLVYVVGDLEKNGLPHLKFTHLGSLTPEKVECTFSSPWFASQTRIIKQKDNKEIKITEDYLEKIIEKEVNIFKESKEVEVKIRDTDTLVIEKQTQQILLNGYETQNPYGKIAKEIEIALLISVALNDVVKDVTGKIMKVFSVENISFNTFPSVFFNIVRSELSAPDEFILVDISGELTDVSVVRNNVLINTSTFPAGKKNIIRELSKKLKTSTEDALSQLRIMDEGRMEDAQVIKFGKILGKILEKEWVNDY